MRAVDEATEWKSKMKTFPRRLGVASRRKRCLPLAWIVGEEF